MGKYHKISTLLLLIPSINLHAIDLRPDTVSLDLQHLSHISQHFTSDPTNYGTEFLSLQARWDFGRVHFTVAEGGTFGGGKQDVAGPVETFQAHLTYDLWRK